jgi:serine/threonine protein kinase
MIIDYASRCRPAKLQTNTEGEVIGRGKYGTVRIVDEKTVVKVIDVELSGDRWDVKAKQAYREYVVGVLQRLVVSGGHTPHLVIHFSGRMEVVGDRRCALQLYMERFECSLDKGPKQVLSSEAQWRSMYLQLSSGVAALALLLGAVHNDLYPRNVLLRRLPRELRVVYDVCGTQYLGVHETLFAIADFGICGSPLFGCGRSCNPGLRLNSVETPRLFGQTNTEQHILKYAELPPFSRDIYVLFKWPTGGLASIYSVPQPVLAWSLRVLRYVDEHLDSFTKPRAVADLLSVAFSEQVLSSPARQDFSLRPEDADSLLAMAAEELRRDRFGVAKGLKR